MLLIGKLFSLLLNTSMANPRERDQKSCWGIEDCYPHERPSDIWQDSQTGLLELLEIIRGS